MQTTFTIQGTHCKACKFLIEDVAGEFQGIQSCDVNFETGETSVHHDESLNWEAFAQEIESLGTYKVVR